MAALLRDPANELISLSLQVEYTNISVRHQAVSDVPESLQGNTQLKELWLDFGTVTGTRGWCTLDRLLCDVVSIETIANSNHTLENISVSGQFFHYLRNNASSSTRMRIKLR